MVQNIEAPFKKPKIIESGINIMQIFDVDTVVGLRPERDLLLITMVKECNLFWNKAHFV